LKPGLIGGIAAPASIAPLVRIILLKHRALRLAYHADSD